jgi:hypothetical protein
MDRGDVMTLIPVFGIVCAMLGVVGWIVTTWLRERNGGDARSVASPETIRRMTFLADENADLRAELGAVRERLSTIERIVTEPSFSSGNEAERLGLLKGA